LIDGDDVAKNSLAIRQKIGYLPETPPLYSNMTVKDYLKFAAEIKGIPANQRRRQLNRVLEECQLGDVAHKTIATLSKGYKQRTGIAQAIIHEPKILILDEPTSGLDPIQNLQLRNLIKNLKDQRTVILSTHILSEIEQIAQRVLIIKTGEIIVDESLDALLNSSDTGQSRALTLEEVFVNHHGGQSVNRYG
jgi:ABC-2 type transport system ATP-binding protein